LTLRERIDGVFYGWWMLGAGVVILVLCAALFNGAYGAYVKVLHDEFGWSKASLSFGFALARLESGLFGPLQGWLTDRFGSRTVIRGGLLIFASGLFLFSQVNSLPLFFAALVLVASGSSLGGFLPLNVAVVNWFHRRRATALSILSMGMSLGGLILPLIVYNIENSGWRETAFGSGVAVLLIGLPASHFIRDRPEQYGMVVDGIREPAAAPGDGMVSAHPEPVEFTPKQALRTPAFWLIALGHASALLVVSAVVVHLISHLNENQGYSLSTAAWIVTLITIMQFAGNLTGGIMGDRFNQRLIVTGCLLVHMVALLLMAYAWTLPIVILGAMMHGFAWGVRGPLMGSMRADYFGRTSFGMILGLSSLIVMFGSILGPIIAGVLADQTGDYKLGFTVLAVFAGLGSLFFFFAQRPRLPEAAPASASVEVSTV
jgi:sugar phosphate permease